MQLTEVIEHLAIATEAENKSPRTVQAYREKLSYLVRFLGDPSIESVTAHDLRRFMVAQREKGLSPFTIKSRWRAFRRLWNFAEEEGIITENPAQRIKAPRTQAKPKGIKQEDFEALLGTTNAGTELDLRDHAIIRFLYDTGVRVGGLCGMQIEHLKLEHLYAKVTEKREKTRKVYFQESTAQALRAWLAVRPDDKGPWVFVGLTARAKGQMDANSVGKMLRRRGKQAGCKGPVNPHAFRHGFAISATMSGCPLGATSKILGHSDPAITIKYYHQFTDDQLQEIHAKYSPITKLESGKDDD